MDEETRTFGGIEYTVIKTPCTCPCHSSNGSIKHVMACCFNGYKEHLVRKVETITKMINGLKDFPVENADQISVRDMNATRLITKRSCYRTFITDLERLSKEQ